MRLFERLFGAGAPEIRDPDQLRDALFEAAQRGDRRRLERLCQTNRQAAAYRKGLACAAEPDVKTRLLVELGVSSGDKQERLSLLREAQSLNGNLVAAATATVALKAFTDSP
jgi:hypothetical protein